MNKDEIINNLITNINTECQKRNISSAELFRRSGVHKSVLDNLKRNSLPAIDIIVQISTYLGVSVDYLIGYKWNYRELVLNRIGSLFVWRKSDDQSTSYQEHNP